MLSHANSIVFIWFLPVLLHIIIPLVLLAGWLLCKPFITFKRNAGETTVEYEEEQSRLTARSN